MGPERSTLHTGTRFCCQSIQRPYDVSWRRSDKLGIDAFVVSLRTSDEEKLLGREKLMNLNVGGSLIVFVYKQTDIGIVLLNPV